MKLKKEDKKIISKLSRSLKEDEQIIEDTFKLFFNTTKKYFQEEGLQNEKHTKFIFGKYFKFQIAKNRLANKIKTYTDPKYKRPKLLELLKNKQNGHK